MIIGAHFSRDGRDSFVAQWRSVSEAGALLLQRVSWESDCSRSAPETAGQLLKHVVENQVDWHALHQVVAADQQLYSVVLVKTDSNEARLDMIGVRARFPAEGHVVSAHLHDQLPSLTGALGDGVAIPVSNVSSASEICFEFGNPGTTKGVILDIDF
jgi:hypothetical protein